MYKVRGGKLKVFSKYVELFPGEHTIYMDMDTGSVSYTGGDGYTAIVRYSLDETTGNLKILEDYVSHMDEETVPPTSAINWMNGRLVSKGPLSDGDHNVADVYVALDGFAFDFNYTAIAHAAQALKPLKWTGGRVCFSHGVYSPGDTNPSYTAYPGAGSCGRGFSNVYDNGVGEMADMAGMMGGPTSGFWFGARGSDMEYLYNNWSIVFTYRTFRKYVSFAKGMSGVFSCSLGVFGGKEADIEPDGDIGNIRLKSFTFSMYNLKQ